MREQFEELRTLIEISGYEAKASDAKSPLSLIKDSKGRLWRAHGKRVMTNMHGGATPEVRMAPIGTDKKGSSIWIKMTKHDEPGLYLTGVYKEKFYGHRVPVPRNEELSYNEAKEFIETCLQAVRNSVKIVKVSIQDESTLKERRRGGIT